jgi:enamine deaminase RidA (YjgF/YER057c/UK114 family)
VSFFDAPYPARRTVQAKLIRNLKVEIEVIATL